MPTPPPRRPWQHDLAIVDRTMRKISSNADPEELVQAYWEGLGDLNPIDDFVSVSRRDLSAPYYRVTRSSRFTEEFNPWTQRDRLPLLAGGLIADLIYANAPAYIDDLPARVAPDDPARAYLDGFAAAIVLPQYDGGESLNMSLLLLPPGHAFDPAAIPMLHWQASLFGRGTQNLVLRNQLAAALARLDRELQAVGAIQRSLLPATLPDVPGFALAAHYRTSARAGGDYYDFFPLDHAAHGLFIADVSGHGTPAAVLMAITHALAHAKPRAHTPPPQLLTHLNDALTRAYTRNGTFVTAFYAVLDPQTRTLTYSSAGHNPPRLVRDGSRVIPLDENAGLPLGIVDALPYHQAQITLQPGDLLLLYTDGITEAMAPAPAPSAERELFGPDRLDQLLLTCRTATPQQTLDCVNDALATFTDNAPPTDDRTMIAIRCL